MAYGYRRDLVSMSNFLKQIKAIQKLFPDSKLIAWNATKKDIDEFKKYGIHGIPKRRKIE